MKEVPVIGNNRETIEGTLERILFFSEENHFCIGEFLNREAKQTIVIAGSLPGIQCGETLKLQGNWVNHPQYGRQFKITAFESKLPSTLHGIRKYLSSGLIPGIGTGYANKIVDFFKTDTLKVISEESARLKEIPGIGKQRAQAIKKAWDEQHALREVFMFLKTYGVSNNQCLRLVKRYGDTAILVLKSDPYRIAIDLDGIGFKTADKIALNLGLPTTGNERLDAGILYAKEALIAEGHTCAEIDLLAQASSKLLVIDKPLVVERIQALVAQKNLVLLEDQQKVQLPSLQTAERSIAQSLELIYKSPSLLPPIIIDKAIQWAQEHAGFEFAPEQTIALQSALSSKISVITGGPGTGKTTILRALVKILKAKKIKVLLAAPTGRAAQRMSQACLAYAQTIHRLLKFDPNLGRFTHDKLSPLSTDFIIVDEASMIDTKLANALFKSIPSQAHLLLVGDVYQLPSVGPGTVLNDIINAAFVPSVSLNKIFRQKKYSNITTTAHAIHEGQSGAPGIVKNLEAINPKADFQFIEAPFPEDCVQMIVKLCKTYIPQHCNFSSITGIQVLAPLHKGLAGISTLNQKLQAALNPNTQNLFFGGIVFKIGDKVIQTHNNYDKSIFNGDLGVITAIDAEMKTLTVNFEGQSVELEHSELPDIALAYAISIHKSQGSEFPIVIIPLLKQHFIMLRRNLLYTAITRGRRKVFIVGDPIAYAMAVNNTQAILRQSGLPQKLAQIAY